ncbi:glutamine amidotransferase type 2 domain protein [Vibrio phage 1.208.B._10N.222.52.A7]|nr:glutamine amidotransferase type 2 domain protein [Vibrio phage 1.208.B._10N.222.52.A7]
MCGIFGISGSNLTAEDVKTFRQLAIVNYLRGVHATGMAVVTPTQVMVHKKTDDAITFTSGSKFARLAGAKNAKAFLGHCRHATAGNADDPDGAHPFTHGHITGTHNGTLFNRDGLDERSNFIVDSEHVMYSLSQFESQAEITNMLEKLDGAFALAWYDSETQELNLARNDERELAYCVSNYGEFIYCSELAMLEAIVDRRGIKCLVAPTLFPIGEHWCIPAGAKIGAKMGNVTKTEFTPLETWGSLSGRWSSGASTTTYTTPARNTNTVTSRISAAGKAVLKAVNLELDGEVCYTPIEYNLYPNQEDYCMVKGISETSPFYDVILHGVPTASPLVEGIVNSESNYYKAKAIGVAAAEDFDKSEPSMAQVVCFGMEPK